MPQYFRILPGLDQGWTQCAAPDVVLYQVVRVANNSVKKVPVTLLFYLQTRYLSYCCVDLSICIVQTVCVCTLWTSCLSQNFKIKKINLPRNKFIFTTYLNSGQVIIRSRTFATFSAIEKALAGRMLCKPVLGDQTKNTKYVLLRNPVKELMVGYLLYRCKHLCMILFRVVSSSSTKVKYI